MTTFRRWQQLWVRFHAFSHLSLILRLPRIITGIDTSHKVPHVEVKKNKEELEPQAHKGGAFCRVDISCC